MLMDVRHVKNMDHYPGYLLPELSSIIKPWPFRGWAMDLIGKVRPTSKKRRIVL
jgi:hypothetical protein